jgi:hypothetical protein
MPAPTTTTRFLVLLNLFSCCDYASLLRNVFVYVSESA